MVYIIMLEIHHSGGEPLIYISMLLTWITVSHNKQCCVQANHASGIPTWCVYSGGWNSSVSSVSGSCPTWRTIVGSILLWASGRGDFYLGVNMGFDPVTIADDGTASGVLRIFIMTQLDMRSTLPTGKQRTADEMTLNSLVDPSYCIL